MKTIVIYITLLTSFLLTSNSQAKMVRYLDENGKAHYVNTDYAKVPEQYLYQFEEETPSETEKPEETPQPEVPEEVQEELPTKREVTVEIFVKPNCRQCTRLEIVFRANKIIYSAYDIESDSYGQEIYRAVRGDLPLVRVDSEFIEEKNLKKIVDIIREKETGSQ